MGHPPLATGFDMALRELRMAEEAVRAANPGRARVCARRAALAAMREFSRQTGFRFDGRTGIERLRSFSLSDRFPKAAREAAQRLTTHVNHQLTPSFSFNPIGDGRKVIHAIANALGVSIPTGI